MASWARERQKEFLAKGRVDLPESQPRAMDRASRLWEGIPASGRRALESSSSRERVARQEALFPEGAELSHLYVVESGSFKLVRHSEEGKELIVGLAGAGDAFGALAGPAETTVLARALEDSVVLAIPLSSLRQLMAGNHDVVLSLLRTAEERLRSVERQAARLAFESVPRRLAHLLLETTDESGSLRYPLNQTELANLIGSSRETVCSLLNRFRREEIVELSVGQVRIRDRRRLASVT